MKLAAALLLLVLLSAAPARAETTEADCKKDGNYCFTYDGVPRILRDMPAFRDYPAEKPLKGPRAKDIDWASHPKARRFRTRLREGLQEPPNFNGHYRVVMIGCGSGCHLLWFVDLKTGKVAAMRDIFPVYRGYDYRLDSRLVVFEPPFPDDDMKDFGASHAIEFAALEKGRLKTLSKFNSFEKMEPPQAAE